MSQVAARLLRPIRASLSSSLSHSMPPRLVRVKSWIKGPESRQPTRPAAFSGKLLGRRFLGTTNSSRRGGKVGVGSAFGASLVAGIITIRPEITLSFDDHVTLMDIEQKDSVGSSDEDDNQTIFWTLAGKLWLPVLFALTVLLSLDHPMHLAVKVILFLLSTKPSPLSVYLFIEQMRYQSVLQGHRISRFQSLHANKVEVHDYKFLCLARVEMRDQKLALVGILGGWWKLPLSSGSVAF